VVIGSYHEFDLQIQRDGLDFRAQVLESPAGQIDHRFRLPFASQELQTILESVRNRALSIEAAQGFGRRLFEAVFGPPVLGLFRSSLDSSPHLRLRIRLDDVPELAEVPWEFLYDETRGFLARSPHTPIVRYLNIPRSQSQLTGSLPLRVLVILCGLKDYPPLDTEGEWQRTEHALQDLIRKGVVKLARIEHPTLDSLRQHLRDNSYDVLHFLGHGGFDETARVGGLVFEDADGNGRWVSGEELSEQLGDHTTLRLVVLNACDSGRANQHNPLGGVAQHLLRHGVSAVVAMQFPISNSAAIRFAHEFYAAVATNYPVEAALAEGRKALDSDYGLEWSTPVLYMRTRESQLFKLELPQRQTRLKLEETLSGTTVSNSLTLKRVNYYSHIILPATYVPRPTLLADIKQALYSLDVAITSSSDTRGKYIALHGMGGVGKSVMARALCDDSDIQAHFPDGILWATLGKEPDLVATLRSWISALGGTLDEQVPTPTNLKALLGNLLQERACLLIVDDVWRGEHAKLFQISSLRTSLLITTRDAAVVEKHGFQIVPIPTMTSEQSLDLLVEWSTGTVQAQEAIATQIVKRLGFLPLAIKLAGAQLRRRSPSEWLKRFDVRHLRERRIESVHDSLELTLNLSLDELSPEQRRLYTSLAIFREDEAINKVAVQVLWDGMASIASDDTVELLADLADRALLEDDSREGLSAVRLHDLLREIAAKETGDEEILGAHQVLLNTYRKQQRNVGWHTVSDDGYLYEHLCYHLRASRDENSLRELFAEQYWMHARLVQCDGRYDGYLRDLEDACSCAASFAHHQVEADEELFAFTDLLRYTLIRTSINSLATGHSPNIIARAIKEGIWDAQRALVLAKSGADSTQRARLAQALLSTEVLPYELRGVTQEIGLDAARSAIHRSGLSIYTSLIPYLEADVKSTAISNALAYALSLEEDLFGTRTKALIGVLPYLDAQQRRTAIAETLSNLRSPTTIHVWHDHLAIVAPYLDQQMMAQALDIIDERKFDLIIPSALRAIGSFVPASLRKRVLKIAYSITDKKLRMAALVPLAPILSVELMDRVFASVVERAGGFQSEELERLIPFLPQKQRAQAIDRALAQLANNDWIDERRQARLAVAIAPYLSDERKEHILDSALTAAVKVPLPDRRREALEILLPVLSEPLVTKALGLTLSLTLGRERRELLDVLATALPPDTVQLALDAALILDDNVEQAQALVLLAQHVQPSLQSSIFSVALQSLDAIVNAHSYTRGLVKVAPYLPPPLLEGAIVTALDRVATAPDWLRNGLIQNLAPFIPESLAGQALSLAVTKNPGFVKALAALAPQLATEQKALVVQQVKQLILELEKPEDIAVTLPVVAPLLDEPERTNALTRALNAASQITSSHACKEALAAMLPQLSKPLFSQALDLAIQLPMMDWERVDALSAAVYGADDQQLSRILHAALTIDSDWLQAELLALLAPRLGANQRTEVVRAVRAFGHHKPRAVVLAAMSTAAHDAAIQREVRATLIESLKEIGLSERSTLLGLLHEAYLIAPPILSTDVIEMIARDVMNICDDWHWQN